MSEYQHSFVSVEDTNPEDFAKRIEHWISKGYYIAGSTIGVSYRVAKWFPLRIERTHWAFLQKNTKIEKDDEHREDTGD